MFYFVGYYADVETGCQVFRVCTANSRRPYASFMCPENSLFNQNTKTCDWWKQVKCTDDGFEVAESVQPYNQVQPVQQIQQIQPVAPKRFDFQQEISKLTNNNQQQYLKETAQYVTVTQKPNYYLKKQSRKNLPKIDQTGQIFDSTLAGYEETQRYYTQSQPITQYVTDTEIPCTQLQEYFRLTFPQFRQAYYQTNPTVASVNFQSTVSNRRFPIPTNPEIKSRFSTVAVSTTQTPVASPSYNIESRTPGSNIITDISSRGAKKFSTLNPMDLSYLETTTTSEETTMNEINRIILVETSSNPSTETVNFEVQPDFETTTSDSIVVDSATTEGTMDGITISSRYGTSTVATSSETNVEAMTTTEVEEITTVLPEINSVSYGLNALLAIASSSTTADLPETTTKMMDNISGSSTSSTSPTTTTLIPITTTVQSTTSQTTPSTTPTTSTTTEITPTTTQTTSTPTTTETTTTQTTTTTPTTSATTSSTTTTTEPTTSTSTTISSTTTTTEPTTTTETVLTTTESPSTTPKTELTSPQISSTAKIPITSTQFTAGTAPDIHFPQQSLFGSESRSQNTIENTSEKLFTSTSKIDFLETNSRFSQITDTSPAIKIPSKQNDLPYLPRRIRPRPMTYQRSNLPTLRQLQQPIRADKPVLGVTPRTISSADPRNLNYFLTGLTNNKDDDLTFMITRDGRTQQIYDFSRHKTKTLVDLIFFPDKKQPPEKQKININFVYANDQTVSEYEKDLEAAGLMYILPEIRLSLLEKLGDAYAENLGFSTNAPENILNRNNQKSVPDHSTINKEAQPNDYLIEKDLLDKNP